MENKRIIVGISGASGVIYGVYTLKILTGLGFETHLILSEAAKKNLEIETGFSVSEVESLAGQVHHIREMEAPVASGSYQTLGMVVAPCSIKTLSAIANSYNENLLIRAADVSLKEKRKLILMVRETPLHLGHLELMRKAALLGAFILPPVPAFYHQPKTIEDLIHQTVGKVLDLFEISHNLYKRWGE
jgi:4-hydroxy-3-polyprenylbenzoate decarboxylase